MKFIFVLVFVTIATASRNHHHHFVVLQNAETPSSAFGNQDTSGFYTIIHNGEDSPKSSDDMSNGLHSFVDTSVNEQTNSGGNVLDINYPPEPVTDTPEVEMARKAHFQAYREAALMAAMSPDDDTANESSEHNSNSEQVAELQQNTRELLINKQNSRKQLLASRRVHGQERVGQEIGQQQQKQLITTYILTAKAEAHALASGQGLVHAQAQIEHPFRSEEKSNGDSNTELETEQNNDKGNGHNNESYHSKENGNNNGRSNGNGNGPITVNAHKIEKSNENSIDILHRNTIGNAHRFSIANGNGHHNDISNSIANGNGFVPALLFDNPHVINNADSETTYYAVDTPDTHYTVVIPTVLTTLPRIESIRLGENGEASPLPVSKSFTYITQRLKSSNF